MLWTRIPTARLVDFVDQAILYLHLRGPVLATTQDGDGDEARKLLARHGIRTATDLERTCALASSRSRAEGERLVALLDDPALPVHRLQVVLDALGDDEWMVNVRNWRDQSHIREPVRSVGEFVQLAAAAVSAASPTPLPDSTEKPDDTAAGDRLKPPSRPGYSCPEVDHCRGTPARPARGPEDCRGCAPARGGRGVGPPPATML